MPPQAASGSPRMTAASYLDKRPNERTIPNATPVDVDLSGVKDFYILTKNYIGINHGMKGYK